MKRIDDRECRQAVGRLQPFLEAELFGITQAQANVTPSQPWHWHRYS